VTGKIRIECKQPGTFNLRVLCDGVVLPATALRIHPVGEGEAGWLKADVTVLVHELELDGVHGNISVRRLADLLERNPVPGEERCQFRGSTGTLCDKPRDHAVHWAPNWRTPLDMLGHPFWPTSPSESAPDTAACKSLATE